MNILKKNLVTLGLSLTFLSTPIFAQAPDFSSLLDIWNGIEISEEHNEQLTLSSGVAEISEGWVDGILKEEISKAKEGGLSLTSINAKRFKHGSRKALLKAIFPKMATSSLPAFCQAFASFQQEKDPCKREAERLLGGIIHADPEMLVIEASYENREKIETSAVVVYVRSYVEPNSYLRYRMAIR